MLWQCEREHSQAAGLAGYAGHAIDPEADEVPERPLGGITPPHHQKHCAVKSAATAVAATAR
jgi:hypothetical protein